MSVLKYSFQVLILLSLTIGFISCDKDDDPMVTIPDVDFSGMYVQADQMGRPGVNTVFVPSNMKDDFNTTTPSNQAGSFQPTFQNTLMAVNPGYTTNALGLDAETFTTVLATDVLTVAMNGTTTFFDGTNVLTGRALADDVIDTELLLIFGGPDGSENASLTSDNVDSNDKSFDSNFPYLAAPW